MFARNGAEALVAAAKHRPALILLDVEMPDMDGYDVCRRLKRDRLTEAIPVIFVTSRSDEPDEAAGFDAGGVDYITKPVSAPIVRARVRTHLSLVRAEALESSYRAAIYMLGEAAHYKDTDTGLHIWRMAAYSRALAEALGWDAERCSLIELAAAMHDTGKIGIPDAILTKPGKLNAEEWEIMKTHSRIGHDILAKGDAPLFRLAAEIALSHHERWDGSGYPMGLAGEAIPESGAHRRHRRRVRRAVARSVPTRMSGRWTGCWQRSRQAPAASWTRAWWPAFLRSSPHILAIKASWEAREARAVG